MYIHQVTQTRLQWVDLDLLALSKGNKIHLPAPLKLAD